MNVALRRRMTIAEFLAWEERQEERWEFDGFEPVAMVGGTAAHSVITLNVGAELRDRLRGGPCRAYIEGLKILPADSVRYPDVFVTCDPVDDTATVAPNPVVVFEVLSPSTSGIDQITKNTEYRATPSIQRYVMLTQDRIGAMVYARRGEDWVGTVISDPAAVLDLPEIGVSLPLASLYEGVFTS